MLARLALEREEDVFVDLAREATAELSPKLQFSPERTRATFQRYLETANPTIWVCEHERKVIGASVADWGDHAFSAGILAEQRVIYVSPDHRGTRAAAKLLSAFRQWADRLGATEKRFGSIADRKRKR